MGNQLCPKCGSMHTFVGPASSFCNECGHHWGQEGETFYPTHEDRKRAAAKKYNKCPACGGEHIQIELGIAFCHDCYACWDVNMPDFPIMAPAGLPPTINEPIPTRHKAETADDVMIDAGTMVHDLVGMAAYDSLRTRIVARDFVAEMGDYRIVDRNQQRTMSLNGLIDSLRKEAQNAKG